MAPMSKTRQLEFGISIFEHIITFLNIVIVLRLLILSINIENFRVATTGKLSQIGQNIKFVQMIFENITNPIIKPFDNLLLGLLGETYRELASVLTPMFVIIIFLMISVIIKVSLPQIIAYLERRRDF